MEEEGSIHLRSPSIVVGWLKSVCVLVLTCAFSFIIMLCVWLRAGVDSCT